MTDASADKKAGSEAKIEISIRRLSQLLNSFDHRLFTSAISIQCGKIYHRIGRGRGAPRAVVSRGAFASGSATKLGTDLGPSIHNYFAYRAESERRRLRLLFRTRARRDRSNYRE